jgi:hypothetical protein
MKLVKLIKLNNLQYNLNRDPEPYRRPVNEEFRLQALLTAAAAPRPASWRTARTLGEATVNLPGTFECRFSYDTPGTRVGKLIVENENQTFRQDIRIDVTEHAWIG